MISVKGACIYCGKNKEWEIEDVPEDEELMDAIYICNSCTEKHFKDFKIEDAFKIAIDVATSKVQQIEGMIN